MNTSHSIDSRDAWDEAFFDEFTGLRNRIYSGEPGFLPESAETLRAMLNPQSAFTARNIWRAWMLRDSTKTAQARIFASSPKSQADRPGFLPVGYFENLLGGTEARALFEVAENYARSLNYGEIRGPIQGNIFNGSRLKQPLPKGYRFLGEPFYLDEYHAYFSDNGFTVSGMWETVVIPRILALAAATRVTRRFNPSERIRIREIDLDRWQEELRSVYEIVVDSYSSLPDFAPFSFEEFEIWTMPLKQLTNPKHFLFAELDEKPVGFIYGMYDPLPWPGIWNLLLPRKFLLLYTGKIKALEGRVKGVQGALTVELAKRVSPWTYKVTVCYLAKNSPTFKSLPKFAKKTVSRYVLYSKIIKETR